eukprot:1556287-Karenia_brevis.AAC.1
MCVDPIFRAYRDRHQIWERRLIVVQNPDSIRDEYWKPPDWLVKFEPEKLQFYRWRHFARRLYNTYYVEKHPLVDTLREEAARLLDSENSDDWREP